LKDTFFKFVSIIQKRKVDFVKHVLKKVWDSVILLLIAPHFVILIRLIKPWLRIRFGQIQTDRIGHLYSIEVYLSERDKNLHPKNTWDVFYVTLSKVSNQVVLKKWKELVLFSPIGWLAYYVDWLNRYFPGYKEHVIQLQSIPKKPGLFKARPLQKRPGNYVASPTLHSELFLQTHQHLTLTSKETKSCNKMLSQMNVSSNKEWVCFHSRDSAYLNKWMPKIDFKYHNYRDSHIKNYLKAAEELTKRGYSAIRVGSEVNERLITDNPNIVDYASNYHSDLMDLFLAENCKFFIATCCGINSFPLFFRKPTLTVNLAHFISIPNFSGQDMFLPKKIKKLGGEKFTSFGEIFRSTKDFFVTTENFLSNGYEVLENTPEELLEAVVEMDERLKGQWIETKEDKQRQETFWDIVEENGMYHPPQLRICNSFLRRYPYLLEES